jgi:hypothetical protein
MTLTFTPLTGLLAGTLGLTVPAMGSRALCQISSDDGLTGGGARAEDASNVGPFVVDAGALRRIAEEEGDEELADLLDKLDDLTRRFMEHAANQLDALKDGKPDEAKKHYDEAMELSPPWHRLMRDIHEHAKRKGYYG